MNLFLSPMVLVTAGLACFLMLIVTTNAILWTVAFVCLAVAIWIAGGRKAYFILIWLIGFFWLAVAGDLGLADLQGVSIADGSLGNYRELAIYYSLAALIVFAVGTRLGSGLHLGILADTRTAVGRGQLDLNKLLICYGLALAVNTGLSTLAGSVPSMTSPILAFSIFHYFFLFLIATTVFENKRGYGWLLTVLLSAMGTGMIGYWSSYKEPVFIVILAMAAVRKNLLLREWALGLVAFLIVVWMSLVWSIIKPEYRTFIVYAPLNERIAWISDAYLNRPIDYSDASERLLGRVGYTTLFATILAKDAYGAVPQDINFSLAAVEHVLMPRVLFPDKAALNDSAITDRLLGWKVGANTSIGVGWAPEFYVDFGFPGMLVPVLVIGVFLGGTARYFMTRNIPSNIQHAFTVTLLFLAFPFAADIDKAFGQLLTQFIAMALVAKFIYPEVSFWLEKAPPGSRVSKIAVRSS